MRRNSSVELRRKSKKVPSTGYLPTLDGWRALAVGMVIVGHDRVIHLGRFSTAWFHGRGEFGVNIFFAISGLLICSRLLQEEKMRGSIGLKGFYIRRLCRIQPAALTFLAVLAVLCSFHVIDAEPKLMLASVFLIRNYIQQIHSPDSWYTDHFWSLSVEEHFYLFLPTFLVLVRRFRLALLGALVVAIETWRVVYLTHPAIWHTAMPYFHTDITAGPIVLAAFCAILITKPPVAAWCTRWLWPGFAVLFTGLVLLYAEGHNNRLIHATLVLTFPLLVLSTMFHPRTLLGRLLESPPLRYVGRISYSLYLWQMLFMVSVVYIPAPRWKLLAYIQQTPLRYVALIACALLSYYCIELPMMRLGHRLARPATPGREELEPEQPAHEGQTVSL